MKLPPQAAAVLRQSTAAQFHSPPHSGVVPLAGRHVKNDELEGMPYAANPKKAKVTHISCAQGKHWCYCKAKDSFAAAYECCPGNTTTCAFDGSGNCVCA